MASMTAMMSLFMRTYAGKISDEFDDKISERLFLDNEYIKIAESLKNGAGFFNPSLSGKGDDALDYIVKNYLGSTPVARRQFALRAVKTDILSGATQYLIFGSGYDSFAYSEANAKKLKIFEIDRQEIILDKLKRLRHEKIDIPKNVRYIEADLEKDFCFQALVSAGYSKTEKTISSLLGLTYYLKPDEFAGLIGNISEMTAEGSSIIFDYSNKGSFDETGAKKRAELAKAAGEEMKGTYSYHDISSILLDNGFLIYEHMSAEKIENDFFSVYNVLHPNNGFHSEKNVCLCLAVKKRCNK